MMKKISEKLQGMTPYDGGNGDYAICLNANESFVPLPVAVKEEMLARASRVPLNRYPDPYAGEVCEGFAKYYGVDPSLVTVGNGSDEIIGLLMSCLLDAGDKVLTMARDFSMYGFYAHLYGCEQVVVEKTADLVVDVEQVITVANEVGARMIVFSNPCNPTSIGMLREQVIRILAETEAIVVVDEAYMEFYDQSVLDLVGRYEGLVVLKTCSKALALAGLRLGFAVADQEISYALKVGKSPYNVNAISQAMGAVIFAYPELIESAIGEIKASKRMLYHGVCHLAEVFPQIKRVLPTDTNFVFMEMVDAQGVYEGLLDEGILVRRMGDYLRITAGTLFENDSLLEALRVVMMKGVSQ